MRPPDVARGTYIILRQLVRSIAHHWWVVCLHLKLSAGLTTCRHSLVVGLEKGLVRLLELESRELVPALLEPRDDLAHKS